MKFAYSDMDWLISEYVTGKRAARDRQILRLHFLDGLTYEQIAERVELSAVQVGRIIRKRGDELLLMIQK